VATRQNAPLPASNHEHGVAACWHSLTGPKLHAWQFHSGKWAITPQKVSRWWMALYDCLKAFSANHRFSIVLDADTMLSGKLLKCLLGKDGLSGRVVNLEVHKMQSGVVFHKK
jgi:hypothetical protein